MVLREQLQNLRLSRSRKNGRRAANALNYGAPELKAQSTHHQHLLPGHGPVSSGVPGFGSFRKRCQDPLTAFPVARWRPRGNFAARQPSGSVFWSVTGLGSSAPSSRSQRLRTIGDFDIGAYQARTVIPFFHGRVVCCVLFFIWRLFDRFW